MVTYHRHRDVQVMLLNVKSSNSDKLYHLAQLLTKERYSVVDLFLSEASQTLSEASLFEIIMGIRFVQHPSISVHLPSLQIATDRVTQYLISNTTLNPTHIFSVGKNV